MKYLAALVALVALLSAGPSVAATPNVVTESQLAADGSLVTFTMNVAEQAGGSCGYVTYTGQVKKTNYYGVTLWTWQAYIRVGYCNYKVVVVSYFYSQPINSCCGWDYKGQVGKHVSPLGGPYIDIYIKGQFQGCVGVAPLAICDTDYPWFTGRINGNGILTSYNWGY